MRSEIRTTQSNRVPEKSPAATHRILPRLGGRVWVRARRLTKPRVTGQTWQGGPSLVSAPRADRHPCARETRAVHKAASAVSVSLRLEIRACAEAGRTRVADGRPRVLGGVGSERFVYSDQVGHWHSRSRSAPGSSRGLCSATLTDCRSAPLSTASYAALHGTPRCAGACKDPRNRPARTERVVDRYG
jgi:hypothetical protein